MFGVLGRCLASVAGRPLNINPPWQLTCYVKNGAECGTGCHPELGGIALATGPSWTFPQFGLMYFRRACGETNQLGIASPSDGSLMTVGSFNTNQWYKITVRYRLIATNQVGVTYLVDDGLIASLVYSN